MELKEYEQLKFLYNVDRISIEQLKNYIYTSSGEAIYDLYNFIVNETNKEEIVLVIEKFLNEILIIKASEFVKNINEGIEEELLKKLDKYDYNVIMNGLLSYNKFNESNTPLIKMCYDYLENVDVNYYIYLLQDLQIKSNCIENKTNWK